MDQQMAKIENLVQEIKGNRTGRISNTRNFHPDNKASAHTIPFQAVVN